MKNFWRFLLRKSLSIDVLSSMNFAVFGLGDSSYEKFNYPAKKLYKRLSQLGGRPLIRRGDGDDQHYLGIDGALDPWLNDMWATILPRFPLPVGKDIIPDNVLSPPLYQIKFLKKKSNVIADPERDAFFDDRPGFHMSRVLRNERITFPYHYQDVRHIELDAGIMSYEPGDVAVIQPRNLPDDVEVLIRFLGWLDVADIPLQILPSTVDMPVPDHYSKPRSNSWTLRRLLTHRLSVLSPPRRYFFELASFFTSSDLEREKLREFASAEGQEDLQQYCYRQKRTPLEVFKDFPNCRPTPEYVFDIFPEMKPREFSIASAREVVGQRVNLCIAIVRYKTMIKDFREGVCTRAKTWSRSPTTVYSSSAHP